MQNLQMYSTLEIQMSIIQDLLLLLQYLNSSLTYRYQKIAHYIQSYKYYVLVLESLGTMKSFNRTI